MTQTRFTRQEMSKCCNDYVYVNQILLQAGNDWLGKYWFIRSLYNSKQWPTFPINTKGLLTVTHVPLLEIKISCFGILLWLNLIMQWSINRTFWMAYIIGQSLMVRNTTNNFFFSQFESFFVNTSAITHVSYLLVLPKYEGFFLVFFWNMLLQVSFIEQEASPSPSCTFLNYQVRCMT